MEAEKRCLSSVRRLNALSGHVLVGEPSRHPEQRRRSSLSSENCFATSSSDESPPPPARVLSKERESFAFEARLLADFMNGGEENTRYLDLAALFIQRDPFLFDRESVHELSIPEQRERTMQKIKRWNQLITGREEKGREEEGGGKGLLAKDEKLRWAVERLMHIYDSSFSMRIGVHTVLFKKAVEGAGTPEQVQHYAKAIDQMNIIGCFGMTEMGNGSSIQQFETVATFDRQSCGFFVTTPTITATKWWIGMAAHTATHCVVFARLIVDDKDCGVHNFVVPLRDRRTGELLAGVTAGDVGVKYGRQGLDNGWLQFSNVWVPLDAMLMRWAQLSPDGTFTPAPIPQLVYSPLIGGRVWITRAASDHLKVALTIATRYAAVRRQHSITSKQPNSPLHLLDLQSHQLRLMPLLADVYAMHFAADQLQRSYQRLLDQNFSDLSSLPDFHSLSSGLKAWCTWMTQDGIELCRRCCGGHGYSAYTGLSTLLADFAVYITGEGDNMVMAQQNARLLLSAYKIAVTKGKKLSGSVDYLSQCLSAMKERSLQHLLRSKEQLLLPDVQLEVMAFLAAAQIERTGRSIADYQQKQQTKVKLMEEGGAWNAHMSQLVRCSKLHCLFQMLRTFHNAIEEPTSAVDERAKATLRLLRSLFFVSHLHEEATALLYLVETGASSVLTWAEELRVELSAELRKHAILLTDAFHFPDFVLQSEIGRYDGNIYENYLARARRYRFAVPNGKPHYWQQHIRPLTYPSDDEHNTAAQ
ncbi:fatty-acyl coenzyme A oxidase [Balamuthia mandrillaris]